MSKKDAKEAKAPKVENVKVSPFSNDTTFQVSAPFGAGGTGTTVYGTYGDNGEHSYYYYQDNGDLDQITLDKGSSRYTWLDNLVKDQVKNNAKYPSWFTRLFPGVAPKQKFGGNMNYASYLEGGGAAPQNAAPQVSKEDIAEVITAALNGTGETKQKATEALQEMMQDASLAPLVEQVMSEMGIPAQKCGGRVKKKEMGSKLVKAEKAKCGCALKKVGGRLIEVDTCTGLPIHRNGGNVVKLQNASQPITVNANWWHNKRYSKDQIKQIQSALNKAALGKQIAVDGIFGKETAAAIRAFQQQHNDILKVDGLAGDQTLSALGITGIGDASLPQTRAGINQAKKASIDTSTAQGKADKQASDYYNSPEMLQYLMNATNAATGGQEYLNHYYNALNYVSPEIASKLRTLNNEGDAYDQEVSKNREQSFNRAVGIKEFKNAIASGHLKTSEDYDRWMTSHNLSKEEMQELMNDPASSEAMLRAGVIADNGRVNSDAAQGKRFQKEVTNTINEAGVKYALPAMLAVGNVATAGASSILPLFGSAVGGRATNVAVSGLSDGQYQTWGQFASDRWGKDPNNRWLWEMTNPGAIAGAIIGGVTPGQGIKVGQAKVSDAIPSQKIPAGHKWVEGYVRPITKQVELVNSQKVVPNEPFYQNPTIVRHRIPVGEQNISGYYKKMYQTIPGKPAVYKDIRIGTKPTGYSPTLYTSSVQPEPPVIDIPKYDTGMSYGPYLGINRFQFKEGGPLNYAHYLN